MLTAEELRQRCYAVREQTKLIVGGTAGQGGGGVMPLAADDALADEIERDISEYRDVLARVRVSRPVEDQEPPRGLAELLWLMGWLIYEASWQRAQDVESAFEALTGERRTRSEDAARLVRIFAEQARSLPWPQFAPRAVGAIRADALASSKRDTAQGYAEAFTLHREADARYQSYLELHGDRPERERYRLGLQEVLLQLALAQIGTACRTAERVIGRWSEELDADNPQWREGDEDLWLQLMFKDLIAGVTIGGRALDVAAEIEDRHGFSIQGVTEERLAMPTAFQNPGIMTARAALLVLALCPEMERLGREPGLGCQTWAQMREALLERIRAAYKAIERPVPGADGRPAPLIAAHQRSLLQIRLNLGLLVPGCDLPSGLDFVPCLAANPLDDAAVEALSACLAETAMGGRPRGDASVIGSAVMPAFIRSVDACRAIYGVEGGYREWRRRWFSLDRYSSEPGRRDHVEEAIRGAITEYQHPDSRFSQRSLQGDPASSVPDAALPVAIRRVVARDDLLMLAREAEGAVGIVLGQRGARTQDFDNEATLFSAALHLQRETARHTGSDAIRIRALTDAGVIVRFCDLVGISLTGADQDTPAAWFHADALREVEDSQEIHGGEELDRDRFLGLITQHSAIRDLRLAGDYQTAIELADLEDKEFAGTGADQWRADYQFELAAALILDGQAAQVRPALIESEQGFWATGAVAFPGRHRFDYTLALAAWAGGDLAEASARMSRARQHLHETGHREERWDVEDLLVALAQADLLAAGGDRSPAAVNEAADRIGEALDITERIRDRWKVISRSCSPLSVAFRRIYGDIALAASAFAGQRIAELGLRAALSAKQTGFALRMRTSRAALAAGSHVRDLVNLVVDTETSTTASPLIPGTADATLQRYRRSLQRAVSPMLADAVLPASSDPARVTGLVGDRYALDYLSLPDASTLWTGRVNWFRTLIEPSGAVTFERLTIGDELADFIGRIQNPDASLATVLEGGLDWQALATDLLPVPLRNQLLAATEAAPAELIISAHAELSLMPWPALKLESKIRLIHRAIVTQTPVLSFLAGGRTPAVSGSALIELASQDPDGLRPEIYIEPERLAWGLYREPDGHVPLSECAVEPQSTPVPVPGPLAAALAQHPGQWRLLHIAAHGRGSGLDQTLYLRGEPISAGRVLTLSWPESVLITSSNIRRLVNLVDAEPLNLVTAFLASGSRCVVAGIDTLPDQSTSSIAADVVMQCRQRGIRLDAALREAQIREAHHTEGAWALLSAYAR